MPTFIKYNDTQILSGQPVPLFGITENAIRYGEKWGTSYNISLQGSVTGCTYNTISTQKERLLNIFSKDYQPLQIIENNKVLFDSNYNIIRDINFDSSSYVGILNYNISIESYPANLFSGVYGVLNPVDEWDFTDTEDQLLEINHKISAQGFNTSSGMSNSFDNCRSFVLSRTGMANWIQPYFVSYCTGATLCLDTFSENINRLAPFYEVNEKYILDVYNGGAGYIRYTTDYNCNALNGIATLGIQGDVKSCRNADLATLRSKYQSFDLYSAAVRAYFEACGRLDLNPNYLSSGINEDVFSKKIGFNVEFDNDYNPRTFFEYSTNINVDDNDITTVGIKGTIKSRGDLQNKWNLVESYFTGQLNLFYLAYQSYNEFYNNSPVYPLNPRQLDYSISKNQFLSEIDVATSYSNKDLIPIEFQSLDYTIGFRPAITQIKCMPLVNLGSGSSCNSNYYCVNLGFKNRAEITVGGRAVGACTGNHLSTITGIKGLANFWLLNNYTNDRVFLNKHQITQINQGKGLDYNFQFGWSFDAPAATVSPFSFIDTLSLK